MIQCRHVTCHACACAGCAALLDELDALRDCGQAGVCRVPPGCARHWEERNRELVAECEALRADADVLETVAENRHAAHVRADAEVLAWRTATGCDTPTGIPALVDQGVRDVMVELYRLRELEAAVLDLGDAIESEVCAFAPDDRLEAAIAACRAACGFTDWKREMQRRGF